ncbi:MAG: phosphate/phosphite/phosphonate ABC transporter substrate-binding protein [Deltaproteobacteria bacterium]|jgi:serine/threonine-protein kinase|nr:phosphate/phosphite/phosphonate ABC transporter substrate-binding protein [Deltaproteobacteria bacterium]MBW2533670.1 phosphate/phosphite/phosphonate ABC transporter substrate-binding protein [Deltaproteobacteria bacterium]
MATEDRPSIAELKEAGKRIGPFEVRELLGTGGMGEVWLAHDAMLHRDVALKVLADDQLGADAQARLIKEARAASALDHPGIVQVHQLGHDCGRLFIAMEYVAGRTLAELIDEGPVKPAKVVDIVRKVADALGAAHEAGIVHRDVKPENVMVRDDGRVKVLDFGLVHAAIQPRPESLFPPPPGATGPTVARRPQRRVRAMDETAPAEAYDTQWVLSSTVSGIDADSAAAGTPLYMAPEQIEGHEATPAADQFALAACAFELLCGRPVRSGGTLLEVLTCQVDRAVDRAADDLPARAVPVLKRALEPEPTDRYDSVGEFAAELESSVPLLSLRPRSASRAPGRTRRRPLLAGAGVALVGLLGGAIWWRGQSGPAELKLAIIPGNRVLFAQIYAPLSEHLSRRIGIPVRLEIPGSYSETVDGLVDGRYHMAFLPPAAYVEARKRLPDLALLGGRYYSGDVTYRSIIVARRDDADASSLAGLRGKRICFVDQRSTSGYLVPRRMIAKAGVDPHRDLGETRFLGDHFKVLREVRAGTCDAGAVSSMQWVDGPRQGVPTKDLRVIAKSDPLPPIALAARPELGEKLLGELRQAIVKADREGAFTRESELSEEMGRFGDVADQDYDVIRAIHR